jgi:hypothetical protein
MAALSQEDRELAQALRVQAMTDAQRSAWLHEVWGKLQHNAAAFKVGAPAHQPSARSFASPEEKNRFDEARELAFAMSHSIYAAHTTT